MVEYFFWDVPLHEKINLSTLYGPYLALCKSHPWFRGGDTDLMGLSGIHGS
jgi:hypothetical protein